MKNSHPVLTISILMTVLCILSDSLYSQNIGVGTTVPDFRLHIANSASSLLKLDNSTVLALDISSDLYFKTGAYYTGALKSIGTGANVARLGLFTYAATNSAALFERVSILDDGKVGIGVTAPGYILDVNGRMRIRSGGGTSGLYLMNNANNDNTAFIGMLNDNYVGLYGDNGAGWNMVMNVVTGHVGIGTTTPDYGFEVIGGGSILARFENTETNGGPYGVYGSAKASTFGEGVFGSGYIVGVEGEAILPGSGNRFGVYGSGENGGASNYGVYGHAFDGATAYGVYGKGEGANTNYGGYFVGDVYTTGSYLPSDRKLKNEIRPLTQALDIIQKLKPSFYTYKTDDYKQMQLPEGIQYGLIADEVEEVLPGSVKKTVQPAEYETGPDERGKLISEEVEFNAVNYMEMIPILIGAVQEQQLIISQLQTEIDDMEKRLNSKQ
jgi:hypothetical protein